MISLQPIALEGRGIRLSLYAARRDGTVRDVVMYSILASEWPDVRRHLELRLDRHGPSVSEP